MNAEQRLAEVKGRIKVFRFISKGCCHCLNCRGGRARMFRSLRMRQEELVKLL